MKSRLLAFWKSPWLTSFHLFALFLLTLYGTFFQVKHGLYLAHQELFASWFVNLGPIGVPGVKFILLTISIQLALSLFTSFRWCFRQLGLMLSHLGALLLIASAGLILYGSKTSYLLLAEGSTQSFAQYSDKWDLCLDIHKRKERQCYSLEDLLGLNRGKPLFLQGDIKHIQNKIETPDRRYSQNTNINRDSTQPPLDHLSQKTKEANSPGAPVLSTKPFNFLSLNFVAAHCHGISGEIQDVSSNAGYARLEPLPSLADPLKNTPCISLSAPFPDHNQFLISASTQEKLDFGAGKMGWEKRRIFLPFSITLLDFQKETYPGSLKPRHFESRILVRENGKSREIVISMNQPWRRGSYTLYQDSYLYKDQREYSQFSLVNNPYKSFPYFSSLIIVLGLFIHYTQKLKLRSQGSHRKSQKNLHLNIISIVSFLALFYLFPSSSRAEPPPPPNSKLPQPVSIHTRLTPDQKDKNSCDQSNLAALKHLRSLQILSEGRKKPLDSFARLLLLQTMGRQTFEDQSALHWLLQIIFTPETTPSKKFFKIDHPELKMALRIDSLHGKYFSYNDILPQIELLGSLAHQAQNKTISEQPPLEIHALRLYRALTHYVSLASSLHFSFGLKNIADSTIFSRYREIYSGKKDWIPYKKPTLFTVLPGSLERVEHWFSPWEVLNLSPQTDSVPPPEHLEQILALSRLTWAYRQCRVQDVIGESTNLLEAQNERLKLYQGARYPQLENFINAVQPLFWVKIFLFMASIVVLFPEFISSAKGNQYIRILKFIPFFIAFLLHSFVIISRWLIRGHPPVTTLYETFIFVSWLFPLICLIRYIYQPSRGLWLVACIGSALLLHTSGYYVYDGDPLGVLVAVLRSNFWLSSHVMTISIGYMGCLAAGLLSHLYLVHRVLDKNTNPDRLFSHILALLRLGLIFTVLGTVLGGVWADQSWGRFWGWDPKENGALLIILWNLLILHAYKAGIIGSVLLTLSAVMGNLVVAFAWFGVNLLGLGLHSYGFSRTIFIQLFIFFFLEGVFVILTGIFLLWGNSRSINSTLKS